MEQVEYRNALGPPTLFLVEPIEPADLVEAERLLAHVGIDLQACYRISNATRPGAPVMEAVTATSVDGVFASVTAVGSGMPPAIGAYRLLAGMTVGDAVRHHWQGLEIR